uniref:Uncharacterized protein n=1 Tax=Anguilla anguilla TaxID=7936 RepID=A0A0E9WVB0_ANGAN
MQSYICKTVKQILRVAVSAGNPVLESSDIFFFLSL